MNALVEAVLAQHGRERPALVGEGFAHSGRETLRAVCARAAYLGDRLAGAAYPHVGLLLENTPAYVWWLEAAALAGATVVGVNPTRRGADLLRDLTHTDCALLVTEARLLPLLADLPLAIPVLVVDSPEAAEALTPYADAGPPTTVPAPRTRLLLTFTSGSTGAPKAVVCSQGRLARAGDKLREQYGLTDADTGYACMPLFHGNALMGLWAPLLLAGGTIALRRRFSATGFLADVRAYRAGYFTYVGRAVSYVLATPPRPDDAENPLRLGFGTEAGAVDAARFEQRFGCRLVEGYGSSEGGCNLRQDPAAPPGAVGREGSGPYDDLAVVDPETGEERPRSRFDAAGRLVNGEEAIGELVNRTARAGFEGYWRNERAGAARLRDGWYWTGDLFHRDADGWFRFAGRSADWLRVDSENLAVADIENILARWDSAAAVAVYAVPDPVAGDQVMAAVELRSTGDPLALAAEFAGFLGEQRDLGTKMPPRFLRVVARMPVTATHKTAKTGLREERWDAVGDDLLLWRPYGRAAGAELEYRPFTGADREKLAALFAEHGRSELIVRNRMPRP
ncbi:AMP-binding protein [Streptacidiphilus jiangxiensis]|uniref:Fatty-acyl-CoA synthase n=1 Tax=Streptacidiphilus jiangxiensis TaxID=235985 RepID=A0A1H7JG35_STRJI|nr:AMP-binding protein [Streptacidiphilus jiangxiensis]SEK73374.1 fatty-acyl-CoA synthase [Streptacidiphilus jiangxiensis]